MAASPSVFSNSKGASSLKHDLAYNSHVPPLSGLALILVLLLAEEVQLVVADGDHEKFASALRAKVSKLLVENELQMSDSDTSQKILSRKADSIQDFSISNQIDRELAEFGDSNPFRLISHYRYNATDATDTKEVCLTLPVSDSYSIDLEVCNDSDEQKWTFNPEVGIIQSLARERCLYGGINNGPNLNEIFSEDCDTVSVNTMWLPNGRGFTEMRAGRPMTVGTCGDFSSIPEVGIDTNKLLSSSNWIQLGQDIDGTNNRDHLGWSVSISSDGTTVAIGAPYNDDLEQNGGHVQVIKYNEVSKLWVQLGDPILGTAGLDTSGKSVSLSSDGYTVAIGGPDHIGGGDRFGCAKIYRYDVTANTPSWKQLGGDFVGESNIDNLGHAVSISSDGNIVAIASPYWDLGDNPNTGRVQIYKYNETDLSWGELGDDITGIQSHKAFGTSVSISSDGSHVAISGERFARVFGYNEEEGWEQLGADIEDAMTYLSVSISSDGSVVAVGDPGDTGQNGVTGKVRVFSYSSEEKMFKILGDPLYGHSGTSNNFGKSISLSPDGYTVAVGANGNLGTVSIYNYNVFSESWSRLGSGITGDITAPHKDFGGSVSMSADGFTVAIGVRNNGDYFSGRVRIYRNEAPCAKSQSWDLDFGTNSDAQNEPSGMLDVEIKRTGNITVSEGSAPTKREIGIDYLASTNGGATIINVTIFEKDCKTEANATLPTSSSMEGNNLLKVKINYDFASVENNPDIWEKVINDAGEETGGSFRFCIRVNMFHVPTNHGLNFHETNLTGEVDKTVGADFDLVVGVNRKDATEESVNDVDFDASVVGSKCDVSTLATNNDPVSQGSVLGLCVKSNTTGIKVVGWDSLTISRNSTTFNAITGGVHVPVLVAPLCGDDTCTSQVQLISSFFDDDGELSVSGKVILAVNDTRRNLAEGKKDIARIPDESFGRLLDEGVNRGGFELGIKVVSSVSASTTLYPGSFYPLVVAFTVLKFLIR